MRKLTLLCLASLLSFPAMAQQSYHKGDHLAVALGFDSGGHIQPYTDWGQNLRHAEFNALERCGNADCVIEASWSYGCRFIAYNHLNIRVTPSLSSARNYCNGIGSCTDIVQRCPR